MIDQILFFFFEKERLSPKSKLLFTTPHMRDSINILYILLAWIIKAHTITLLHLPIVAHILARQSAQAFTSL